MSISKQTHLISYTAVFAAMITVMTAYVGHIPYGMNGGYIHFGDSLIYLAAVLLPTPYALAAAAIGGALADLLTAPIWTLATIIIKMLIVLPFSNKKTNIVSTRNIVACVLAFLISGIGYFLAELVLFGNSEASIAVMFFNATGGAIIQGFGSALCFLAIGTMLDKVHFKLL